MTSTRQLRIHLGALSDGDRRDFGRLCEGYSVLCVESGSFDVLVLDGQDAGAPSGVETIPPEAVLVIAGCENRPSAGAIAIVKPFQKDGVRQMLLSARALLERRAGATSTLSELAARYRFELARNQRVMVAIEGNVFELFPQKSIYRAPRSIQEIEELRGERRMRISVEVDPPIERLNEPGGAAKRLEEFLWQLGYYSREGALLPWLNQDQVYRLNRWPAVARRGGDSTLVKLGTVMARRAFSPRDLSNATGIEYVRVAGFLNGCSIAGCLESCNAAPSRRDSSKREKDHAMAGLLSRIRVKLGLA